MNATAIQNQEPSPPAAEMSSASDSSLLKRFIASRDEAAFTELVSRYGPLVLGVCGRLLSDQQDVEDAFQATFLVLSGDARKIRKRRSIASWLYGVAHRISLRALSLRYRRREEALREDMMGPTNPLADLADRHEQEAVDDELNQLPEKYREPLVLYYLMGNSSREVADALQLSLSATEGRLRRGREKLRARLARRGIGMVAVLAAIQSTQPIVSAAVTQSLATSTIQAGISYCGSGHSSPLISQKAAHLAGKEIGTMSIPSTITLTTAAIVALAIGISGHSATSGSANGGNTVNIQSTADNARKDTSATIPIAIAAANRPDTAARPVATPQVVESQTEKQKRIEAALASKTQCDFENAPLGLVIQYFGQKHKIPFAVELGKFAGGKPHTAQLVTATLKGVTLDSAMKVILEPLKLHHVVQNGALLITSANLTRKTSGTVGTSDATSNSTGQRSRPAADYKRRSALETKIEIALEDTKMDVDFVDSTLKDVRDHIQDHYKIPIIFDSKSIASGDISIDQEINLVIKDVSLRNALELILKQHTNMELDFVMRNGVLQIVTAETAEDLVETRIYKIGHLRQVAPEAMSELIQRAVQPDTWREASSKSVATGVAPKKSAQMKRAAITTLKGALAITQTQRAHYEIVELLDQLKRQAEDVR